MFASFMCVLSDVVVNFGVVFLWWFRVCVCVSVCVCLCACVRVGVFFLSVCVWVSVRKCGGAHGVGCTWCV